MQGFTDTVHIVSRHWKDDRGKIFAVISACWFLSIGVRFIYPVLLPHLRTAYELSLTAAGLLLTILWLSYAVGQLPGGILADRIGEGSTMMVSMSIAVGTIVLVVTAGSATVLFVATAALGFAIALFGVVRLTALADIYPEHVGTAHGLLGAVGDIGNSVLPAIAGVIAATTLWQFGFGFLIPIFVLVIIGLWVVVPTRTSPPAADQVTLSFESVRHVLSALRHPALILVTAIQIFGFSIIQSFTGFYPTYLIEIKELSPSVASGLFALFFALGVLIRPASGTGYDRIGARRSLLFITGVSGIGLGMLAIVDGFWSLVVVTILVSTMLGRGTITMAYMTVSLPGDIQNTGLGTLRTIFFLIGAMSPFVFGMIADRGFFDEAFLLLAALSGITLLFISQLPPTKLR